MICHETKHFLDRAKSRNLNVELIKDALQKPPLVTRPGDSPDSEIWRVKLSDNSVIDVAIVIDSEDRNSCTLKSAWKVDYQ